MALRYSNIMSILKYS